MHRERRTTDRVVRGLIEADDCAPDASKAMRAVRSLLDPTSDEKAVR